MHISIFKSTPTRQRNYFLLYLTDAEHARLGKSIRRVSLLGHLSGGLSIMPGMPNEDTLSISKTGKFWKIDTSHPRYFGANPKGTIQGFPLQPKPIGTNGWEIPPLLFNELPWVDRAPIVRNRQRQTAAYATPKPARLSASPTDFQQLAVAVETVNAALRANPGLLPSVETDKGRPQLRILMELK